MRKTRLVWIIVIILVAVGVGIGIGIGSKLGARQTATVLTSTTTPTLTNSLPAPLALSLLATDVLTITREDMRQTLPLSGALRAAKQVAVKAWVSGEVREVSVREGESVQAGRILVRMDGREYLAKAAQARGALAAARGQLDIATKSRNNNQALIEKGFISQNAFDNAASQLDIAQANVDSAKATLEVAQKSVDDTVVKAPIAGIVSRRSIEPGEKIAADAHLLDIVDLRNMEMDAAIPTSDIQRVTLRQEVRFDIEGVATPMKGLVTRIDPATQAGSRSIIVHINIDNPKGLLRAGMFGEGQLTLKRRDAVLTIPVGAIQHINGQDMVYVIQNDVLQRVPVQLGITGSDARGEVVEVVSGLEDGATIVRNNLGSFVPGTRVMVEKQAATQ